MFVIIQKIRHYFFFREILAAALDLSVSSPR
jgi:hypothetical protein